MVFIYSFLIYTQVTQCPRMLFSSPPYSLLNHPSSEHCSCGDLPHIISYIFPGLHPTLSTLTQMEVVVLSITNTNQKDQGVNDRCGRRVLSEVLGLVSAQQSLGLDLWCWSTGKFLVEANYTLHTGGIFRSTESLVIVRDGICAVCISGFAVDDGSSSRGEIWI